MTNPRKVYIPSGLIASLYNVYGGRGGAEDALSSYDIQLLCAFTEFYSNYTEMRDNKEVYHFYSLPQFYKAYIDVKNDDLVQEDNSKLEKRYVKRVYDDYSKDNPNGKLYKLARTMAKNKHAKLSQIIKSGTPNEVDRAIYNSSNKQTIDYNSLALNPYAYALQVENDQNFRREALYKRGRVSSADPSAKLSLFLQKKCRDESCFFVLKPERSAARMTEEEFASADRDMRRRLRNFFNSDSYKAMVDQKTEDFAPDHVEFLKNFLKAVEAFNKMKFLEDNRKEEYAKIIRQADEDSVGIEVISD